MSRALPENRCDLTIYPAGRMSGIEDNNLPWFRYITKELRWRGYSVLPPVEVEYPGYDYGGQSWEDFLRADIEQCLSKCNALLLGPGWTQSRGACAEFAYAAMTGKFIFFWDQYREEMIRMDEWLGVPDGSAQSKVYVSSGGFIVHD